MDNAALDFGQDTISFDVVKKQGACFSEEYLREKFANFFKFLSNVEEWKIFLRIMVFKLQKMSTDDVYEGRVVVIFNDIGQDICKDPFDLMFNHFALQNYGCYLTDPESTLISKAADELISENIQNGLFVDGIMKFASFYLGGVYGKFLGCLSWVSLKRILDSTVTSSFSKREALLVLEKYPPRFNTPNLSDEENTQERRENVVAEFEKTQQEFKEMILEYKKRFGLL